MVALVSSPHENKVRWLALGAGLLVLLGIGGAALAFWPEEPEPVEAELDADTGMTEDAQIQLAIEIGYLQQE
jgi:hypothetical protein